MSSDYVLGVDVSYWQRPMNFAVARASGAQFVFLRATIGTNTDADFVSNAAGADAAGLLVGAYHVVHPAVSATRQIATIEAALAEITLDFPIALDCEITGSLPSDKYAALIQTIAAEFAPVIIYTRASWWNARVARWDWARYPLWVAHYGAPAPTIPADWRDWQIWQWSADGNGRGEEFGAGSSSIDLNWMKPEFFPGERPPTLEERVSALEERVSALECA